jgi:hypothetical protein
MSISQYRIFLFCLLFLFFTGCKDKTETVSEPESQVSTPDLIPYPTPEMLEQIGTENKLDTRWLLPDSIFVVSGKPKRFLTSSLGVGNEAFLSGVIEHFLQVPFVPIKIEQFVQASALPGLVQIEVDQNGTKSPQTRPFSRRSTILVFTEPIDKEKLFTAIFGNTKKDIESKKRKGRSVEYYDLTPEEIAIPQRLAISFIDERTLTIVEGLAEDIKTIFEPSSEPVKNAAVDRIKRYDLDSNDLVLVASLEGIVIDPNILKPILLQSRIPQSLVDSLADHLRAASFSVNLTAPVGSPMLTVRFDTKDPQGATVIGENIQGIVLMGQTTLDTMDNATKITLPIPVDFAVSALNSATVSIEESRSVVVLNKFEGFEETAANGIRNQQTAMQQMQLQQQRLEQIMVLGQIFMEYYQKNNQFPSDIRSVDGTPLLSWRILLLPGLGLNDLYEKFKRDESWDSPANKPLLEKMPTIFQSLTLQASAPETEPFKTRICFFNSEGTPLADTNLKLHDLKEPQSTLLFVTVRPEKAVEWTKPESLQFDSDKLEEIIGTTLFGLTFAGQIISDEPIISLADPRSAQQRKYLESLVKGLPFSALPADIPQESPKEVSPTSESPDSAPSTLPVTTLPIEPQKNLNQN